jgi:predicted NUDIX family NTP pyrophosphohydrolase
MGSSSDCLRITATDRRRIAYADIMAVFRQPLSVLIVAMRKQSAGLLLYRRVTGGIEVFLVHPGGPYWAKKDIAAWSIPKGEYEPDEDPLSAAKREFAEETGLEVPAAELLDLGKFTVSSSKEVTAWMAEADVDPKKVKGDLFEMEWPPKSGQTQEFPEVDKAAWFSLAAARTKMVKGQVPILEAFAVKLGVEIIDASPPQPLPPKAKKGKDAGKGQTSLF